MGHLFYIHSFLVLRIMCDHLPVRSSCILGTDIKEKAGHLPWGACSLMKEEQSPLCPEGCSRVLTEGKQALSWGTQVWWLRKVPQRWQHLSCLAEESDLADHVVGSLCPPRLKLQVGWHSYLPFPWILRIWTLIFMPVWQMLTLLSHLEALIFLFDTGSN